MFVLKPLAPLLALCAGLAASLVALAPLIEAAPFFAPSREVRWMPAAGDLRPRAPMEGERLLTLRAPNAARPAPARQYAYAFERESAPAGPLAVFAPVAPSSARAFVNALGAEPERREGALFAEIPRSGLQEGINRIEIVAASERPHEGLRALAFGPREPLRAAFARLADLRWGGAWFMAIAGAVAAVLGSLAVAITPERQPLFLTTLAAIFFAAIGGLSALLAPLGGVPLHAQSALMGGAAFLLALLSGGAEDDWSSASKLAMRIVVVGVALALAAMGLSRWAPDTALTLDEAARLLSIPAGAGAALYILLSARARRLSFDLSAIAALLALSLMGALASRVEALGVWGLLAGETLAIVAGGLGLALAALASAARLYVDAEGALQNRLGLGRLVKEQEAQLRDKQAALEAEIAKRAVLEERERFSRDIHDGVGGSLVTLLMQARVGKLKEDDLAPALERALEDLRLMVDALDHSRSSLAAAFSTFQTRVSPAFAAAGIDLDWRQGALPEGALAGPGELIQVFRILQEACANVLKHSRATRAHVRIGWNAAAERFELDIEDDGSAAASNSAPGHGLRNMTQRAEKIGGALSIEPQAPGWAVRLRVPA